MGYFYVLRFQTNNLKRFVMTNCEQYCYIPLLMSFVLAGLVVGGFSFLLCRPHCNMIEELQYVIVEHPADLYSLGTTNKRRWKFELRQYEP